MKSWSWFSYDNNLVQQKNSFKKNLIDKKSRMFHYVYMCNENLTLSTGVEEIINLHFVVHKIHSNMCHQRTHIHIVWAYLVQGNYLILCLFEHSIPNVQHTHTHTYISTHFYRVKVVKHSVEARFFCCWNFYSLSPVINYIHGYAHYHYTLPIGWVVFSFSLRNPCI